LKTHPASAGNDPGVEAKFVKITQAFKDIEEK